ncbi:hypothetical protein CASFOL_014200 [Castilleja foliolosa]|uniref:Uncharacterized protein n=1 Tax=Castilleja foliolosa TaxID=1961234 RepID=A0ABD3DM96_9LAMI
MFVLPRSIDKLWVGAFILENFSCVIRIGFNHDVPQPPVIAKLKTVDNGVSLGFIDILSWDFFPESPQRFAPSKPSSSPAVDLIDGYSQFIQNDLLPGSGVFGWFEDISKENQGSVAKLTMELCTTHPEVKEVIYRMSSDAAIALEGTNHSSFHHICIHSVATEYRTLDDGERRLGARQAAVVRRLSAVVNGECFSPSPTADLGFVTPRIFDYEVSRSETRPTTLRRSKTRGVIFL